MNNRSWTFEKNSVVKNFDKHVEKSVPFYKLSHDLILSLSDFFLKNDSTMYDVGCSTGTLIKSLQKKHKEKNINYIGCDVSKKMVKIAKQNTKKHNIHLPIDKMKLKKSDLITCLYTMQFISPSKRQEIFNKFYKSLKWSGD